MLGKELRGMTYMAREKMDHTMHVDAERKWFIDICRKAAQAGKDHIDPGILEVKMAANVKSEVDIKAFFDWCKSEGIGVTGCNMKAGMSYTFYW